jgi:signal transduction histidine kinase
MTKRVAADARGAVWFGLGAAGAVVGLVCAALAVEPRLRELGVVGFVARFDAFRAVSAVFFGLPGAVVLSQRPGNRLGRLMVAVGLLQAVSLALGSYGLLGIHDRAAELPAADWAMWLSNWMWVPAYLAVPTVFLLLFPDGRLPSRRWRPAAALTLLAISSATVGWALLPVGETDVPGLFPPGYTGIQPVGSGAAWVAQAAGLACAVVAAGAAIAALVSRHRTAEGEVRRQIQWVLAAGLVTMAMLGFAQADPLVGTFVVTLASVPLALAVTLTIVFHRLWEIDLLLARILALATLATAALAGYALAALALHRFLGPGADATLIAIVVPACAVRPLYGRIRTRVNRLVFGDRDDPASALRRIGARLAGAGAPEELLAQLAESIGRALRLHQVGVVETGVVVASWGDAAGPAERIALTHRGDLVGTLVIRGRLRRRDHVVLAELAPHVAVVVHSHRLGADLARSHQRLLAVREEERERLMRELHDGVGPTLAALALQADRGRLMLDKQPFDADRLLAELATRIRVTVDDVRAIVHDLRPPPLDDLGLAGALTELGQRFTGGLVVVVSAEELPPLPAPLELAAYRIAAEALANAARHAHATRCAIRLRAADVLELSIVDDGVGVSELARRGVGLDSMRRRAVELGGTFDLGAATPTGTSVMVRLPLGASA